MNDEEFGALVEDKDIPRSVQLSLIKRRTERGMKPVEIARLMGLQKQDIQAVVKQHGWTAKREIEKEIKFKPRSSKQEMEHRAQKMRRLAKEGYSRKEIGALLGIDRIYVDTLCRRYNIRTSSQIEQIANLYAKGWSQIKIAEHLGVSKQHVNERIKRHNLQKGERP